MADQSARSREASQAQSQRPSGAPVGTSPGEQPDKAAASAPPNSLASLWSTDDIDADWTDDPAVSAAPLSAGPPSAGSVPPATEDIDSGWPAEAELAEPRAPIQDIPRVSEVPRAAPVPRFEAEERAETGTSARASWQPAMSSAAPSGRLNIPLLLAGVTVAAGLAFMVFGGPSPKVQPNPEVPAVRSGGAEPAAPLAQAKATAVVPTAAQPPAEAVAPAPDAAPAPMAGTEAAAAEPAAPAPAAPALPPAQESPIAPDTSGGTPAAAETGNVLVVVKVRPDDARIYRKGKQVGSSGMTVELAPGERRAFEVTKRGYVTRKLVVDGTAKEVFIGLRPEPGTATP